MYSGQIPKWIELGVYIRQGGYEIVVVCLSVSLLATLRKIFRTVLHEIFREGWPMNKRLNFGGDPDHCLDTGIVFRTRHYWEIPEAVNGHKSAAHTDSPNGVTGKTFLGGGIHCPSASRGYSGYQRGQLLCVRCGPDPSTERETSAGG